MFKRMMIMALFAVMFVVAAPVGQVQASDARFQVVTLYDTETITLESGESVTDAISLGGLRLFGLVMPSSWTAADLTFQVAVDGVAYQDFYDMDGNEVTVSVDTARTIYIDPTIFSAFKYVKIRSGTSTTPVAQGSDRQIVLVLRGI